MDLKLNAEGFEEVHSLVWKYENVGDVFVGVLNRVEVGGGDTNKRYYFRGDDGAVMMVWGCVDLDDKLAGVQNGTTCRLTYQGKKAIKGGKTMKVFLVERKKA